jgi:SWI/SNF-related matrix-associated actin-dependent regulator 1 of chromatin subfamily A
MIRRLRKDVLPEYKEPIREIVPLPIIRRKEYREAENDFIKWLNKKSRLKAKRAKKAKRLVQMSYLSRLAAELKMDAVEQWIDDFLESTDEKIILCSIHRDIAKRLHDRYKKICEMIIGGLSTKKKEIAKRSFMTNKKKRVFIGQITAAGVGIDLSKASTVAFVELDYVPGNHSQFEDRAVHINKTEAINVIYLVGRGTIEEDRCNILQKKQKVVSSTLDGTADANSLNLYDELEKKLRKKGKKKKKGNRHGKDKTKRHRN